MSLQPPDYPGIWDLSNGAGGEYLPLPARPTLRECARGWPSPSCSPRSASGGLHTYNLRPACGRQVRNNGFYSKLRKLQKLYSFLRPFLLLKFCFFNYLSLLPDLDLKNSEKSRRYRLHRLTPKPVSYTYKLFIEKIKRKKRVFRALMLVLESKAYMWVYRFEHLASAVKNSGGLCYAFDKNPEMTIYFTQ